ncbi:hypothetical protein SDC9_179188 [bioreactor metagenome]|uniref:Uncharacterized protein n=1 Tax=bioreactor metagenome TaxID=1076179 RepID=A0A645H624_9ZZZZ
MGILGMNLLHPWKQARQIFHGSLIGRLGIHIYQHISLVYSHKIVPCLSLWVFCHGKNHDGPRQEQFPAPARILHMANLHPVIHGHPGKKAVWPG